MYIGQEISQALIARSDAAPNVLGDFMMDNAVS
jgi:hypothetical protein